MTENVRNFPEIPQRRRWGTIMPLVIFGALAALFLLALYGGDPSRLPSALIGKPVPAFDLPPITGLVSGSGKPVPGFDAAALKSGEPTVVNVWASWCAPCREEQPLLMQVANDSHLRVFGINYKDDPEAARRFLGRFGNPFMAAGADTKGRVAIDWGVYGVPETYVVSGRGTIVFKHVGPLTEDVVENSLVPAVEKARQAGKTEPAKAMPDKKSATKPLEKRPAPSDAPQASTEPARNAPAGVVSGPAAVAEPKASSPSDPQPLRNNGANSMPKPQSAQESAQESAPESAPDDTETPVPDAK